MRDKIIIFFFCFIVFVTNVLAQNAIAINIQDTRAVNDLPNFFGYGMRADFKERATIGVPGEGYYGTNITIAPWNTSESSGGKNHQMNFNGAGLFYRNAFPTDQQWGAWRQVLMTSENGNVGIGTYNPTSKLTVAGDINSREVKVTVNAGADYVFEKGYDLPLLSSLETFIKENKHLPEIASAKEMQKEGINLSEMNIKLLQKMEEMTLYIIEQEKRINIQSSKIEILEKENQTFNSLSERLSKLESQSNK